MALFSSKQLSSGFSFHKSVVTMHVSPVCGSEDLDAAVVPLLLPVLPRVCGSQNNNYSPTNSFVRLEHLARRHSGPAVTQSLNQLGTEQPVVLGGKRWWWWWGVEGGPGPARVARLQLLLVAE